MTAALRNAGFAANHKRVLRLMELDNPLALRKRKLVVTTESGALSAGVLQLRQTPANTRPDELWIADISYIRMRHEFVYWTVVLDDWSRKVVAGNWRDTCNHRCVKPHWNVRLRRLSRSRLPISRRRKFQEVPKPLTFSRFNGVTNSITLQ